MKSFRPIFLWFVLPAVLCFVTPWTGDALALDRAATRHGEWWRLWTGHWVHFSASHLCWNLLVVAAAGSWLESLRPGRPWRFAVVAAPLISGALLALEPAMQIYGGLSGLATGLVVLLALEQLSRDDAGTSWWRGLLLLVAGKIAFEAGHDTALFSRFADHALRPSAWAHAVGAATGAAFFLSRRTGACLPLGGIAPVRVATPEKSPR